LKKLTFEMGGVLLPANGICPLKSLSLNPPTETSVVFNKKCIACLKTADLFK